MDVISFLNEHGLDGLTNIKKSYVTDKNVWILNYEQIPQVKDGLNKYHPILCKCRNLVVREESPNNWKIMSQSFRRFFNWNEDIKETEVFTKAFATAGVRANEKFDGSLITVTYFDDKWHIFTRGANADANPFRGMRYTVVDSDAIIPESPITLETKKETVETFGSVVMQFINPDLLDKEITYIFELCTPMANVTRYSEQFLALLAANKQGEELDILEIHKSLPANIKLPEMFYPKSIDEVDDRLKTKSPDFEGYVFSIVIDNIVRRMKYKTPSYVSLHHAINKQFNMEDIVNIISVGEIDEILAYMPQYKEQFKIVESKILNVSSEIDAFLDKNRGLSRKDFALAVANTVNKPVKWLYFDLYQGKYPNALTGFYHESNRSKTAAAFSG